MEQSDRENLSEKLEAARFRGEMEARMSEGDARFDRMEKTLSNIDEKLDSQANDLASIKAKVALFGAIGGLAGSIVVGLIVAIGGHL